MSIYWAAQNIYRLIQSAPAILKGTVQYCFYDDQSYDDQSYSNQSISSTSPEESTTPLNDEKLLYTFYGIIVKNIAGGGGFSSVRHANREYDDRKYILKSVCEDDKDGTADRERAILIHLKGCPYVIKFYGMFKFSQKHLLFEFGGRTLLDILENDNLSDIRIMSYMIQLAEAILHVHDRGVMHRDIKLENIVIDSSGQLKLIDFGLSTTSRKSNSHVGTLTSMAPEVIQFQNYTASIDWWAFGIVFFELINGFNPFQHIQDDNQIRRAISQIDIKYPFTMPIKTQQFLRRILCRNRLGGKEIIHVLSSLLVDGKFV